MRWKRYLGLGLALCLGSLGTARGGDVSGPVTPVSVLPSAGVEPAAVVPSQPSTAPLQQTQYIVQAPAGQPPSAGGTTPGATGLPPQTAPAVVPETQAAPADTRPEQQSAAGETTEAPLGPTPLTGVNILNKLIYGDSYKDSAIKFYGWLDQDYTYRSTGRGLNNIAPVMNRYGDEYLMRQIGIYLTKPLDEKDWSWGFNAIFIGGADASFLTPTAGGWRNTDPHFGSDFTDLNLTAHLPILTDGGVDVKIGRQTTVLGPEGALPWQRFFDSSDYAWYNEEEGRYTGVSATWHVSKWLDWYNGIEFGWGTFFDAIGPAPQYITQLSYWLDEDAKNTKVWLTVLTGPTGMLSTGNTTVTEFGFQHNYGKCWYQIVDTQIVYSKAPIFGLKPPGYQERAYDAYTYIGRHLSPTLDINGRLEWYDDVDGGGYPGGFGIPHTQYYELTVGPDYHPYSWVQFRPEIRYDHATNPAFGANYNHKDQLSIAVELLLKF